MAACIGFRVIKSYSRLIALALFLISSGSPALSDNVVLTGPAPAWTGLIDIPTADATRSDQIRNGISWLLSDDQVNHRTGGYDEYSRNVYKIVDRPGLEQGAEINLQFDPSRHKVTLNHLRIIRDGAVIDRLANTTFDIFRQEKDAEKGIFDGWLTAHVNIDDVRVGDIVDYATTYEITPLVGKYLFFITFATEWEEPVALIRTRIIWPASQPLHTKERRTPIKPSIASSGQDTVYLWEIRNPVPVKVENNLPAEYPGWGSVDVASTDNWQSVVDAVAAHYKPASVFPPAFSAKLDDIAAHHPLPKDRMIEAMRLVQDQIRYVSLSMGAGSYIPRDPATVILSGFGDCKDKALLLTSSLMRLGISAEVALADLDRGSAIDQHLPALRDFDHAIVKAKIGNQTYWLDATNYLQGGDADSFAQPDYGFALPLSSGGGLEEMPSAMPDSPSVQIAEDFDFPGKAGDPLSLTVFSMYEGADADTMRSRLAGQSLTELSDSYLKYYSKRYPGAKSAGKLQIFDRRDDNVVSVKESYTLPSQALSANDLAKKFPIRAVDLGNNLPTPTIVDRTAPISLGSPVYQRHTVTVRNLKARFSGEEIKNVVTPYVSLKASWSNTRTQFEVKWDFQTLASQVPAKAIGDYLKSVDDIATNTEWQYDFTYEDPLEPAPQVRDPETEQRQVIASMFLLTLFVGVPVFIAVRRGRRQPSRS